MRDRLIRYIAAASFALSTSAGAVIIESQDFNSLSDGGTFNSDTFGIGSVDAPLTNSGSFNSGGPGIDFRTLWTDTRGNDGPVSSSGDTSDFIGVNSFTGSNAPDVAADGTPVASGSEHNFEFNDGDGLLSLTFDAVNVSGFENRMLFFDFWINDTGFEPTDMFGATISSALGDMSLLLYSEPELEANSSADDGTANWQMASFDLEAIIAALGEELTLTIFADTNSSSENIFVDGVRFEGDRVAVPEPSHLAVLGLGLLILAMRRRRV